MRDTAPGANDCFRPPEIPVQVYCTRCRCEYDSYLIQWIEDPTYRNGGYWACPTDGCDGKGFTFDIWPTDPDPTGESLVPAPSEDDEVIDQPLSDLWSEDDDEVEMVDDEWVGDDEVTDDELDFGDESYVDDEMSWNTGDLDTIDHHGDDEGGI